MDVELTLPTAPVALAPGVPTHVPVTVRNPYAQPLQLRLYPARGRAAGWATIDPPTVSLDPGEDATVAVVLHAPEHQPPSSSLVPFTVHAEEATTGEPAGFATALLTVALPIPVSGALVARAHPRHSYDLRLANDTDGPAPVRITAKLDPPAGSVEVRPDAVQVEAGGTATVGVRARPARPLMGTARRYAVVVTVRDAYDPEREPFLTEVATGTQKARVSSMAAGVAAVLLALGATAAIAVSGVRLPLPGRGRATPTATAVTIHHPYAMIAVFPHTGGADDGRAQAEAAKAKLAARGMPLQIVDSLKSDVLADGQTGFWVLVQDGFPSFEAAQAFCTQWRPVAPTCTATP